MHRGRHRRDDDARLALREPVERREPRRDQVLVRRDRVVGQRLPVGEERAVDARREPRDLVGEALRGERIGGEHGERAACAHAVGGELRERERVGGSGERRQRDAFAGVGRGGRQARQRRERRRPGHGGVGGVHRMAWRRVSIGVEARCVRRIRRQAVDYTWTSGEGSRTLRFGAVRDAGAWLPLTPALSPHAGRGGLRRHALALHAAFLSPRADRGHARSGTRVGGPHCVGGGGSASTSFAMRARGCPSPRPSPRMRGEGVCRSSRPRSIRAHSLRRRTEGACRSSRPRSIRAHSLRRRKEGTCRSSRPPPFGLPLPRLRIEAACVRRRASDDYSLSPHAGRGPG